MIAVFRHDYDMACGSNVFSDLSQNLNVQCLKCNRKVVNGVKCIICQSTLHFKCGNVEENTVMCDFKCEQCDISDGVFYDTMEEFCNSGKFNPKMLIYIIKQKDDLIHELRDKINILNTQIDLINKVNSLTHIDKHSSVNTSSNKKVEVHKKPTDKVLEKTQTTPVPINNNTKGNSSNGTKNNQNKFTTNQLSSEILKIQTERKCNEVINLTSNEDNWTEVRRRNNNTKYRNKMKIVGNNKEDTVKGVPKSVELHVYRVEKDATVESFTKLVRKNFPEATCEILNSKHPDLYKSFKVTILEENFRKSMNPDLWPHGSCISRFLDLTKRRNSPRIPQQV